MKRIDIYLAVGVFALLLGVYEWNATHATDNKLIEFFLTGTFGALLTLFQQRARIETPIDKANEVNVNTGIKP